MCLYVCVGGRVCLYEIIAYVWVQVFGSRDRMIGKVLGVWD